MGKKGKKNTKKTSGRKKALIITGIIVGAIALFLFYAAFIAANDCATPCPNHDNDPASKAQVSCPTVCERESLLDRILAPLWR